MGKTPTGINIESLPGAALHSATSNWEQACTILHVVELIPQQFLVNKVRSMAEAGNPSHVS